MAKGTINDSPTELTEKRSKYNRDSAPLTQNEPEKLTRRHQIYLTDRGNHS